jgi:uncharacterized membrane protein YtjA (UPF0391 family)
MVSIAGFKQTRWRHGTPIAAMRWVLISDCILNWSAKEELPMLRMALAFFVIALIAAVLGFSGIAVATAGIAKILFYIFLVLFLLSLVSHLIRRTWRKARSFKAFVNVCRELCRLSGARRLHVWVEEPSSALPFWF